MFGGVDKEEYERVVKANNELRMKMEKLRLQNTLLKDQVRVLSTLQPELARLYVFIQMKKSATMEDLRGNPRLSKLPDGEIEEGLKGLMNLGLLGTTEKGGVTHYHIKTPDATSSPKGMGSLKR